MARSLLILMLIALSACQRPGVRPGATPAETAQDDARELVLIATTDFHAAFDRAEGLAVAVRELKTRYGGRTLFLDGGDLFQGTLEGNMSKGRSVVAFFNAIGLDAAALGNHDLDYGPDALGRINPNPNEDGLGNIKARAAESSFKWLSVNFVLSGDRGRSTPAHVNALGQRTVFAPHAVFERAGGRACVIGATTPTTMLITNPLFVRGTRFEPLERTVAAEARMLRETRRCTWVILVAHAGLLCSGPGSGPGRCLVDSDRAEILRLLNKLPRGTLDAVVAGHTHRRAQEIVNGTPVIQAEHGGRVLGVLKLGAAGPRFEPFIDIPGDIPARGSTGPTATDVSDISALLKPYRDAAAALRSRIVGKALAPLPRHYEGEAALGNLIADAVRKAGQDAAGADFALVNAGGLRADLAAGAITYGDLFAVLPFDNSLAVVDVTGAELRRLLEIATSGGHGVAAVSGLRLRRINARPGQAGPWSRDLDGDGRREDWERNLILDVADLRGEQLRDDARYKLATIDFLVMGGDHQSIVYERVPESRKWIFPGVWLRDLVVEYLRAQPVVDPSRYYRPESPRIESISVD